ncbi:hypothetical protein [Comamonas endophytica]|uniref:Secreted protein n=1 Tax=Comamonas endophytica TaxID=2949090 RepID=A0ABY6GF82_9BURK|nr:MULTISPECIES: hypothetical protein [unclassified Acidovorax]MCD2512608.1 hypothetical protein [Acidovorax sp. D4N7]UYG53032.1 hypothetical protein M9799_07400 [Acidovorax sp. 5MLIR]
MRSPHHLQVPLCICILSAVAALASMAMGSAASQQMATKRRISQQLQQDIAQCVQLDGGEAVFCRQQAFHHAEVARSELQVQRHALRQASRRRVAMHRVGGPAQCGALLQHRLAPCVSATPASAAS